MTIAEHNQQCRCSPRHPCADLARILREQHEEGGLPIEITDPGRLPSPARA